MEQEPTGVVKYLRSVPSLALFSRHNGRFLRRSRNFLAFYDGVKANHDHGSRDSHTSRRELWKLSWVNESSFFIRSADQENSYWTVMRHAATHVSTVVLIAYDDVEQATTERPISALGYTPQKPLEVPVCREHGPAMHPALFCMVVDGDAIALKHVKTAMWTTVGNDDSVLLSEDYTPGALLSPSLKVALSQAGPSAASEPGSKGQNPQAGADTDVKTPVLRLTAGGKDRLAWGPPKLSSMVLLHRGHCCVVAGSGRWWKLHDNDGYVGHAAKDIRDALRIRFVRVTKGREGLSYWPDVTDRNATHQLLACTRQPGPALIEPDKAEDYQMLVEELYLKLVSAGDGTELPVHCSVELLPEIDFVRQKDFPLVVKLSRFSRRILEDEEEEEQPKPKAPLVKEREQGLLFRMPLKDVVEKETAAYGQEARAGRPSVPRFVIDAVRFLLAEGRTSSEGLFRVSGRKTCVDKMLPLLEQLVDLEKVITLIESDESQPLLVGEHEVAALLKQFLREMPQGLYTDSLYDQFMAVAAMEATGTPLLVQDDFCNVRREDMVEREGESEEKKKVQVAAKFCLSSYTAEKRSKYMELINRKLPKCNHHTLKAVCFLLHRVMRDGKNKMTATSLSIVMAPNVLRPEAKDEAAASNDPLAALHAMKDNAGSFEVLRACIADYEALFQAGSQTPPALFADLVAS